MRESISQVVLDEEGKAVEQDVLFPNRNLFFISQGLVEVEIKFEKAQKLKTLVNRGQDSSLPTHGPGSFFGEISFLTGCQHSATVRAQRHTTTLQLNYKDYFHNIGGREDCFKFFD